MYSWEVMLGEEGVRADASLLAATFRSIEELSACQVVIK